MKLLHCILFASYLSLVFFLTGKVYGNDLLFLAGLTDPLLSVLKDSGDKQSSFRKVAIPEGSTVRNTLLDSKHSRVFVTVQLADQSREVLICPFDPYGNFGRVSHWKISKSNDLGNQLIAIEPSGRFGYLSTDLYRVNTEYRKKYFVLDLQSGKVTPLKGLEKETKFLTHPNFPYLYAFGPSFLRTLFVEPESGLLKEAFPPLPLYKTLEAVALHPSGKWIYGVGGGSYPTVSAYSVDPLTGEPTYQGHYNITEEHFDPVKLDPESIMIHPNGRFGWIVFHPQSIIRPITEIHYVLFDAENGKVQHSGIPTALGYEESNFTVNPSGTYAYTLGTLSHSDTTFVDLDPINQENGDILRGRGATIFVPRSVSTLVGIFN